MNDRDVVPTVIAPVVVNAYCLPPFTVPFATHTSAPKSTSLFTLLSKSVALVQDQAATTYIPFWLAVDWSFTNTLLPATAE